MDTDHNSLQVKVNILVDQYKEVRSQIQLLHRQSIALAMILIPVLLWIAENIDLTKASGAFVALSPFILIAVVSVMSYLRTASLVYMDMCREIEIRINTLVGDDSLFDFESIKRARFDRICFHTFGPGRIMYIMIGVMFVVIYTYLCARSCQVLLGYLYPSISKTLIIPIAIVLYFMPILAITWSAYRTVKVWMKLIGEQALQDNKCSECRYSNFEHSENHTGTLKE
jgi:hypothetical protein